MSTAMAHAVPEQPENPDDQRAPKKAVRSSWPIYLLAVVVAGLVGGAIGYSFLGDSLAALGIPDPGFATSFGLPFFRAVAWILAALSVGSFMFAAFYISPQANGPDNTKLGLARLTVDGHLASRTGAVSAILFALVALLQVPMVMSDVSGTPLAETLSPDAIAAALEQIATSQVWLISAIIAGITGVAGFIFTRWGAQPVLMLGALGMIVPLGMEGHAATGGAHDYGTNAYLWHLVFMVIWIGGLMALIAHGRRLGPGMQTAVRRYSAVALFAILAVAASGVVSALIRIQIGDLLTTRYGLIIFTKIVGTVLLALVGFAHRQATIPKLGKKPKAFLQLAIGEIVLMAAVAGIAVTMGRTPPPPPLDPNLSPMQIQLGYELHMEPTFFNVFTVWRFDIMFSSIAVLLAIAYLFGLRSVKRQGKSWKLSHTLWWLAGCASLLVVTSSGIGMYMPATYSMHMTGHMLLSMVVPLLMALGSPLNLIMTVWDPGKPGQATPHDWVYAFTESKFLRFITIPWVNLLQFLIVFYAMYMVIPLYELAISEHAGHLLMNIAFLVSGYFYFWELLGPDRIPGRRPASIRLVWLVISMPVHLFLGIYLMQLNVVMGEEFYESLFLPWDPDLLADQKAGGGIGWAFGSFPLTFVFIMLAVEWRRDEKVNERLTDERLDEEGRRREERAERAERAAREQQEGQDHAEVDASSHPGIAVGASTKNESESASAEPEDSESDEVVDEVEAYNQLLQRYHAGQGTPQEDYYGRQFKKR